MNPSIVFQDARNDEAELKMRIRFEIFGYPACCAMESCCVLHPAHFLLVDPCILAFETGCLGVYCSRGMMQSLKLNPIQTSFRKTPFQTDS